MKHRYREKLPGTAVAPSLALPLEEQIQPSHNDLTKTIPSRAIRNERKRQLEAARRAVAALEQEVSEKRNILEDKRKQLKNITDSMTFNSFRLFGGQWVWFGVFG
ncbi:hypothetical protein ABBQ38_011368 [Trebouxia sp. C0009 RCD-2024]